MVTQQVLLVLSSDNHEVLQVWLKIPQKSLGIPTMGNCPGMESLPKRGIKASCRWVRVSIWGSPKTGALMLLK